LATTNSAGAQQLQDALNGLIGLAKMAAGKNQTLFEGIRVSSENRRVKIAVDAPPELLELFLK
jgi:hypothetical protein